MTASSANRFLMNAPHNVHRNMLNFGKDKKPVVMVLFLKHLGGRAEILPSAVRHVGIVSASLADPIRSRIRAAVGTIVKSNPLAILPFL